MSAKPEHYDVIRKPIITEKTTMASENGAVVFEVAIDSNKPSIKEAVESLFDVKVKAVNTTITKGKSKRFRGMLGKRRDVKKAYVTLEEGNTIDVTTGLEAFQCVRISVRAHFLIAGRSIIQHGLRFAYARSSPSCS